METSGRTGIGQRGKIAREPPGIGSLLLPNTDSNSPTSFLSTLVYNKLMEFIPICVYLLSSAERCLARFSDDDERLTFPADYLVANRGAAMSTKVFVLVPFGKHE